MQLSSLISTRISQISVSSGHNSVPVTYHKQWYNSSGTNLGDLVIAGNISGWGRLQALAGNTTDQCLGMCANVPHKEFSQTTQLLSILLDKPINNDRSSVLLPAENILINSAPGRQQLYTSELHT